MGPMDNVNIGKGAVLRKVDEAWKQLTVADCTQLLEELKDDCVPHVDVLVKHGVYNEKEARHVKRHWYADDEHSYWPNVPHKEQILRAGYVRAVELVKQSIADGQPSLPIVSYWICSGNHFQSIVCKSDHQITVILLTPYVSHYLGQYLPPNVIPEDMWLVANEAEIDQARAPALDNWFERGDDCGPKVPTQWDGVYTTQIFGN